MKKHVLWNSKKRTLLNLNRGLLFVLLFGCSIFIQSCSSENQVKNYAKKELISQGYEVLELNVTDSKMGFKGEKSSGVVQFIVKDNNGVSFNGKASVKNKKKWFVINTKVFNIDEIREIN
jgi:hypothetical protein